MRKKYILALLIFLQSMKAEAFITPEDASSSIFSSIGSVFCPEYEAWRKNGIGAMDTTLKTVLPEAERNKWGTWKSCNEDLFQSRLSLGPTGTKVSSLWYPLKEQKDRRSEQLFFLFKYKPNEISKDEKRQYASIDQYCEQIESERGIDMNAKKEATYIGDEEPTISTKHLITKISDLEAVIETIHSEEGLRFKEISRSMLIGDWLVVLSYRMHAFDNAEYDAKEEKSWERRRDAWLVRFNLVDLSSDDLWKEKEPKRKSQKTSSKSR